MKATQSLTRLTALAAAITTALYAGDAAAIKRQIHAASGPSNTDNFTMLDGTGGTVGGTNDVATTWDGTVYTANSDYTGPGTSVANMTLASTTPFFAHTWTAHDIQVFAPGTYSFNTAQGGGNPESGILNVTVPPNRLGLHMLFNWNGNNNIDVFVVAAPSSVFGAGIGRSSQGTPSGGNLCDLATVKNCLFDGKNFGPVGKPAGSKVWLLGSVDGNADAIMGVPMSPGGPFQGFSANFNFAGSIISGGLAPLAIDDSVLTIPHGGSSTISILANDVDIDNNNNGTITTAQLQGGSAGITVSNQTGGTATVNANGTVTWTDTSNVTGTDSFTYTLTDTSGNVSAPATVTIPVGIGTPPVANPDTLSATENVALTINEATDLIANDTDAQTPNNLLVLHSFTQPPLGQGTITNNGNGTLTYTPAQNFSGTTTFTYTIIDTDNNVSNAATVTINVAAVNLPPVAQNDSASVTYNTPTVIHVLANDSDADGDTLTITGTNAPSHGSLQITGSGTTITYTPASGYSGSDSFTYTVSDGHGATAMASVNVTVLGAAAYVGNAVPNTPTSSAITGGSNFTMLDGSGADVGGTNDIKASWDGTLKTSVADTTANMILASDGPTKFFGFYWQAHDVRVFGPGTYTFEACPPGDGSTHCTFPDPLTMTVGPTQIGMHMLFDWGQTGAPTPCGVANCSIDVVQVVELNKAFAGAKDGSNNFGEKGAVFTMTSTDGNGDGIPGIPMVDGAFVGFNANFNLNLTPQFALPVVTAVASQAGKPTSVIVPSGGPVTITATAPAGSTFDWNSTLLNQQTDATLVAANTNGTTSQTFVFNPAMLANGAVTARVTIRDPGEGNLANYAVVPMVVSSSMSLASAQDANNNGIPDGQDAGLPANELPAVAGNGQTYLVQASAGALRLGDVAAAAGASTGNYAAGITAANVGVTDAGVTSSCVGGCFDYVVTGLTSGAQINVVLPLSTPLPSSGATLRKFANGEWRDFSPIGGDAVASAPGAPGNCPPPGNAAYHSGLNGGDYCVQVTITDGGHNDADGTANGTIRDPIGVGAAGANTGGGVSSVGNPPIGGGGGCTVQTGTSATQRLDMWLVGALLGWLGVRRKARQ